MDSISFIKSPISAELEDFKKHFDSCLSSSNLLLNSVIAHIRQKNGKMMRPILVLLAAKLYNEICPATLHAAVALERCIRQAWCMTMWWTRVPNAGGSSP